MLNEWIFIFSIEIYLTFTLCFCTLVVTQFRYHFVHSLRFVHLVLGIQDLDKIEEAGMMMELETMLQCDLQILVMGTTSCAKIPN